MKIDQFRHWGDSKWADGINGDGPGAFHAHAVAGLHGTDFPTGSASARRRLDNVSTDLAQVYIGQIQIVIVARY